MPYLTLAEFIEHTIAPVADVEAVTRLRLSASADIGADQAAIAAYELPPSPLGQAIATSAISLLTLTADAPVPANAIDYATLTVKKRSPVGAVTTIGTLSTSATTWLAGIPVPFTFTEGLAVGDLVTAEVTKSGLGTALPSFRVDLLPVENFITRRITAHESWLNSRLAKRYTAPFVAPVPQVVVSWLVGLVTLDLYSKRGFNPGSAQDEEAIMGRAARAREEIKEAADSKDGLFDLPIRQDLPASSAITRGGPLAYAEASPYEWTDVQADAVRR